MTRPDFYLASSDGYGLDAPRRCVALKRLRGEERDDYMLVEIDPPIVGQPFGLGGTDLDTVVIATRHRGVSLFPVVDWPVHVHVARLLIALEGRNVIRNREMEVIAWAELYPTEESAVQKKL